LRSQFCPFLMTHYSTLGDLHAACGLMPPENPLFSVVSGTSHCPLSEAPNSAFTADCYLIILKKLTSGSLIYGRTPYDHTTGTMLFAKPRQMLEPQQLRFEEQGFLLLVHEDFLLGHELHRRVAGYGYFDYEAHEALHLSPREEETMLDLCAHLQREYAYNQDPYSRELLLGHLATILVYAQRYYARQFRNRAVVAGKTITRFTHALAAYYEPGALPKAGLPTVNLLAEQLCLSPRYLSDLLKSETGKTAMEHIHLFVIGEAKHRLKTADIGIADIAYSLGFEDASYFSRLFRKQVGVSPLAFRRG
jgi:AraC family transcriptional activator of pobA